MTVEISRATALRWREYDRDVLIVCERIQEVGQKSAEQVQVASLKCEEGGHPGSSPELGRIYRLDREIVFVSRITWIPDDEIQLRPWTARAWLTRDCQDERAFYRTRDVVEQLSSRRVPTGERAYEPSTKVSYIRDVITRPSGGMAPELWTRCRKCRDEQRLDRRVLGEMFRSLP